MEDRESKCVSKSSDSMCKWSAVNPVADEILALGDDDKIYILVGKSGDDECSVDSDLDGLSDNEDQQLACCTVSPTKQ